MKKNIIEVHYVISDADGIFRMPAEQVGALIADLLAVRVIVRLEAEAGKPLVIVRKSPADNDPEDPVLRILEGYGIAADPRHTQSVHRHLCLTKASQALSTEPSSARPDTHSASSASSSDWSPMS